MSPVFYAVPQSKGAGTGGGRAPSTPIVSSSLQRAMNSLHASIGASQSLLDAHIRHHDKGPPERSSGGGGAHMNTRSSGDTMRRGRGAPGGEKMVGIGTSRGPVGLREDVYDARGGGYGYGGTGGGSASSTGTSTSTRDRRTPSAARTLSGPRQ